MLGGVAVALPKNAPAELAGLPSGPSGPPLSALLSRLGRGLLAEARMGRSPLDDPAGALRRAEDLAEARAAEAARARAGTLRALREVEALHREADRLARLRDAEDAALRQAAAERERALARAEGRIAALESETERLTRLLEQRFEEIGLLTRERLEREGASQGA